ncbi:MAG: hypothetical protein ABR535_01390 [Pyrinomonadaceae bacterium]
MIGVIGAILAVFLPVIILIVLAAFASVFVWFFPKMREPFAASSAESPPSSAEKVSAKSPVRQVDARRSDLF